jgi:hypothetical protein
MCRCRAARNLLRRLQCGERNWCTAWPPAAPLRGRLGYELHVCRCALGNKPEGVTEQQVGICVYDRPPGYNPNEDNIVRSQARLLSGSALRDHRGATRFIKRGGRKYGILLPYRQSNHQIEFGWRYQQEILDTLPDAPSNPSCPTPAMLRRSTMPQPAPLSARRP